MSRRALLGRRVSTDGAPRFASRLLKATRAGQQSSRWGKLKRNRGLLVKKHSSIMARSQRADESCAKSPEQLIESIIGFAAVSLLAPRQVTQIPLATDTVDSSSRLGDL